ncbi:hypothetical protein [Lysobacter enzymogenes]|uniref:hypothetical protein n=1 Tax=Lysobacter enzymogenes TaxID=69 RepID=UPI001A95AEAE|nr:hypothetical protein [Lysobacter enzymogenes]QQP97761.1 hypothetical protein JHW38_07050 [Lysobacter enzymogenes]
MTEPRSKDPSPSRADGEGLRVIDRPAPPGDGQRRWMAAIAVAVAVTLAGWWLQPDSVRGAHASPRHEDAPAQPAGGAPAARAAAPAAAPQQEAAVPGNDPDDLAGYFRPGDPEPTGAQVIQALQQAGVRTGLGAFNPPGTSPPLLGLAVPDGYPLPAGYVRHHQVTDEGVPIEPVLMFAPGFVLRDARGRPLAMPEDRIVTPELAPPGMPQRQIRIPPRG